MGKKDYEKALIESNTDSTIHRKEGTYRKPLGGFGIRAMEHGWLFEHLLTPTFAYSLWTSIVNGLSAVIKIDNLPDGINEGSFKRRLLMSGRMKTIKVGSKHLAVNITPQKWDHEDKIIKSTIVEPRLPNLSGKVTENYKAVEIKLNNQGISLIRQIYPFLVMMDDAIFNLDQHSKVLAGKFTYQTEDRTNVDNGTLDDSLNDWITNGKPVKVLFGSIVDGEVNIKPVVTQDSTDSFLKTAKYANNNILNIIGVPNNNNEDKKERLITSEVSIQNILQSAILADVLYWIGEWAKDFNAVHNTNVVTGLNTEIVEMFEEFNIDRAQKESTPKVRLGGGQNGKK